MKIKVFALLITTFLASMTTLIKANLTESCSIKEGIIYINFYYENIMIGNSSYQMPDENDTSTKICILEIEESERHKGFGSEAFTLTMKHIHREYPWIETVTRDILSFDTTGKFSLEKQAKILYAFYRKMKATVNEEDHTAFINLKNAGYFDEN